MPKPALRVAFAEGVTPTKWARIWAQRHPEVPLELTKTDAAGQFAVLDDGRALLAFVRLGGSGPEGDTSGMHLIPLYEERPVVVVAKDHVLAAAQSVTLAEIDELAGGPVHATDEGFADTIALVAAGVGAAVVPHSIARVHARRDVVAREVSDGAPTRIALAWLAEPAETDAAAVEEFVGIVRGRTANSSRGAVPNTDTKRAKPQKPQRPGPTSRAGRRHPRRGRP